MHLNDDLLFLIFNTIATERGVHIEHRQTAIRYASQVSRRWRELLLAASFIWGRLVWINVSQKADWMEEVLARSKSSSLFSVTIDWLQRPQSSEKNNIFTSLSLSILQETWESRLEEVDITLQYDFRFNQSKHDFKTRLWARIKKPAANLRVFAMYDWSAWKNDELPENIFSDNAPLLREFTCIPLRIPLVRSPTSDSWMSTITILHFVPSSIEDILNAVSWTPCLRVLNLGAQDSFFHQHCDAVQSMSSIILPRLGRISLLSLTFELFNALFSSRSVSPARAHSCISVLMNNSFANEGIEHDIERSKFLTALSNFFYYHAGTTPSSSHNRNLQWKVSAEYRRLSFKATLAVPGSLREPELYMELNFLCSETVPQKRFLARYIAEYAHTTRTFHLSISYRPEEYIRDEVFDFLLSSLQEVENLKLNHISIQYYHLLEEKQDPPQPLLFPKLMTIYFKFRRGNYDQELSCLRTFLIRRAHVGRPVTAIVFGGKHVRDAKENISRTFSGFHGLQITFGEDEGICQH